MKAIMLKIHSNPDYVILEPFVFKACLSKSKLAAEPWDGEVPTFDEQKEQGIAVIHLAMHLTTNSVMYMPNSCRHPHVSSSVTRRGEATQCLGTAYDEAEKARRVKNWKLFLAIRSKTLYTYSRLEAYQDFQHIFDAGTKCTKCRRLIPTDEATMLQDYPYCTNCLKFDTYHSEYCIYVQYCERIDTNVNVEKVVSALIDGAWYAMPAGHSLNEEEIPIGHNHE